MFRYANYHGHQNSGFPRIRGDVPSEKEIAFIVEAFSPHTRGCSFDLDHLTRLDPVFPAYAGMFLEAKPPCRR